MNNHKTSYLYTLGSAIFAFILWGGWAYYINYSLVAGLTQGCASFLITLFLVHAVTWLYNGLITKVSSLVQIVLPAIITVSFTGTCLYILHAIANTENIVRTIAPALFVAFTFCIYTATKLKKGLICQKN